MRITFEGTGKYVSAFNGDNCAIRCNTEYTDIGDTENLDLFTARHGGPDGTAKYLVETYHERMGHLPR